MKKLISTFLSVVLVAAMFIAIVPPEASAGNTMKGYIFNDTDFDSASLSNGPADYAKITATITNSVAYAKTGYEDSFVIQNAIDANPGSGVPASWAHSGSTPWLFTPGTDNYIAIYETTDGVNSYSGANYTGSTFCRPMTAAAEDICPATNMTPIPTLSVQSDTGTLVLKWKAQMEAYDTDFDMVTEGWTTTMVRYEIYSNVGGSWAYLGDSDSDCGDFNAAWNGQMTFTYAGWGSLAPDWYGFRLAPVYQFTNYENDAASVYTTEAMGPILNLEVTLPPKELDVYLEPGWNLINLPGDSTTYTTAIKLAESIESNTDLDVLSIADWENGWVDYMRRNGASPYKLLSWHSTTSFSLATGQESYLVYCQWNTSEGASNNIWTSVSTDPNADYAAQGKSISYQKGWNNLLWQNASTPKTSTNVKNYYDFTVFAYWNYNTESWMTDPGDGELNPLNQHYGADGGTGYTYDSQHNGAGFFVYASNSGSWTQS